MGRDVPFPEFISRSCPGLRLPRVPHSAIRPVAVLAALSLLVSACAGSQQSPEEGTEQASDPEHASHGDRPALEPGEPRSEDDPVTREARPGQRPRPASGVEEFLTQELDASSCDDYECAEIEVPLSYGDPFGQESLSEETLDLDVVRRPADGEAQGVLAVHLGSAVVSPQQAVAGAEALMSQEVLDEYHLVALERRGVGEATELQCLSGVSAADLLEPAGSDAVHQEREDLVAELSEECGEEPLASALDPYAAAHDVEILRAALDEFRMGHFCRGEGSYLMALYADVYPTKVQRMIFDGGLNPALSGAEVPLEQASGFERAFEDFAEHCVSSEGCPAEEPADVIEMVADLLGDGTPEEQVMKVAGVLYSLKGPDGWGQLATALSSDSVDGQLDGIINEALGAGAPGTEASSDIVRRQWTAHCLDRPLMEQEEWAQLPDQLQKASPHFSAWFTAREIFCQALTSDAEQPLPRPTEAPGAGPLMVLRSTGDPLTQSEWGQRLATQLLSGVPVIYEGSGHGAYGRDECITDLADEFLLTGDAPLPDTSC